VFDPYGAAPEVERFNGSLVMDGILIGIGALVDDCSVY
jgi:hypothetical protein